MTGIAKLTPVDEWLVLAGWGRPDATRSRQSRTPGQRSKSDASVRTWAALSPSVPTCSD